LSVPVQVITWKDSRLQNDLLCVEWDMVKLYSLTHWHGYLNVSKHVTTCLSITWKRVFQLRCCLE